MDKDRLKAMRDFIEDIPAEHRAGINLSTAASKVEVHVVLNKNIQLLPMGRLVIRLAPNPDDEHGFLGYATFQLYSGEYALTNTGKHLTLFEGPLVVTPGIDHVAVAMHNMMWGHVTEFSKFGIQVPAKFELNDWMDVMNKAGYYVHKVL